MNGAILGRTMGEYPETRPTADDEPRRSTGSAAVDPPLSKKEQQAIAHSRGRICKVRRCEVCAPLRERRHRKKQQRKAEARAQSHAAGEPCGWSKCSVDVCAKARTAPDPGVLATNPTAQQRTGDRKAHPEEQRRRQAERHHAGLPCGSENCPHQVCVDGFAQERARRHRARRPCRSATCTNAVCLAGRSTG